MNNKLRNIIFLILFFLIGVIFLVYFYNRGNLSEKFNGVVSKDLNDENNGGFNTVEPHSLSIEALRKGEYPGSEISLDQELEDGVNYKRYIASYKSEGLKIYGLLTIPIGVRPDKGWPVIIFNHGFIPPDQYITTERYVAYQDAFARTDYVTFKSDYRGHGNSEGEANSYGSNGYTIDVINALSSVKKLKDLNGAFLIDKDRIGMWGHSMGGFITLRAMVVDPEIRAGVIWAGVVASYPDMLSKWRRGNDFISPSPTTSSRRGWRRSFVEKYGTPEENPGFWNSISANSYLEDISGPVQLHHGTTDHSVPLEFSEILDRELTRLGKRSELFVYEGDDHNLENNLDLALSRSVEFFDKYVK